MALDTRHKRSAAAHVKRLGKGVTPDLTPGKLWRASVAWSYAFDDAPPPTAGGDEDQPVLGMTWSPTGPVLGEVWG